MIIISPSNIFLTFHLKDFTKVVWLLLAALSTTGLVLGFPQKLRGLARCVIPLQKVLDVDLLKS